DGDLAVGEALPEAVDVLRLLELGTASEEMAVLALEHGVVEDEVLHARLGDDGDVARLGGPDDVGTFAGGHVNDVELAAGGFAPLYHSRDCLGLDEVGARHGVEP